MKFFSLLTQIQGKRDKEKKKRQNEKKKKVCVGFTQSYTHCTNCTVDIRMIYKGTQTMEQSYRLYYVSVTPYSMYVYVCQL